MRTADTGDPWWKDAAGHSVETYQRRLVAGAALLWVGLVLVLLGFLQPWASCPGIDDSSAGCPAGTATQVVTTTGLALAGAGTIVLVAHAVAPSRGRERPRGA